MLTLSGFPMLDDQEFQLKSDEALAKLYKALAEASDEHGFDTDFGGALTVEFEDPPAKFVVSPNAPVKQIWVSAHMKSYKLDWDPARSEFVLPETGQSLERAGRGGRFPQLGERSHAVMPGVYISFPFCAQKCSFCNFASGVFSRESGD